MTPNETFYFFIGLLLGAGTTCLIIGYVYWFTHKGNVAASPSFSILKSWGKQHGRWVIIVRCPYCGNPHMHGGGEGNTPDTGKRQAYCGKGSYDLPEYQLHD